MSEDQRLLQDALRCGPLAGLPLRDVAADVFLVNHISPDTMVDSWSAAMTAAQTVGRVAVCTTTWIDADPEICTPTSLEIEAPTGQ